MPDTSWQVKSLCDHAGSDSGSRPFTNACQPLEMVWPKSVLTAASQGGEVLLPQSYSAL